MIISCPNNNWSSLFRGLEERLILSPRLIFLGVLFANVRFWNPAFTKEFKTPEATSPAPIVIMF